MTKIKIGDIVANKDTGMVFKVCDILSTLWGHPFNGQLFSHEVWCIGAEDSVYIVEPRAFKVGDTVKFKKDPTNTYKIFGRRYWTENYGEKCSYIILKLDEHCKVSIGPERYAYENQLFKHTPKEDYIEYGNCG
jgi:hypothetical protein